MVLCSNFYFLNFEISKPKIEILKEHTKRSMGCHLGLSKKPERAKEIFDKLILEMTSNFNRPFYMNLENSTFKLLQNCKLKPNPNHTISTKKP